MLSSNINALDLLDPVCLQNAYSRLVYRTPNQNMAVKIHVNSTQTILSSFSCAYTKVIIS